MPSGGVLRVTLRIATFVVARTATIGAVATGPYIVLEIADEGAGIPPNVIDRIFDPFFTTKESSVGTGLGLSLVHGIVSDVGGAIDVTTAPDSGTTFTVYLPRSGDVLEAVPEDAAAMPRGTRERILVVDDEESLVTLVCETLEDLDYAPVAFTSSQDAIAAFRSDPARFDLVISDERMPGLSGSSIVQEMRRIRRSIPILIVSGYAGGIAISRAYNAGATEVLRKPLSARDLAASVSRALRNAPRVG
jgi:CheY-like chemotaxis protein